MTQNESTTAARILASGVLADADAAALDPATLSACKRAARALNAYLATCGEPSLGFSQLNLIRAMHLAESATGRPLRDAAQVMVALAPYFTPMQMEFAQELLAECLEGAQGEGWAILDELEIMAAEQQSAARARPDSA